MKRYFLQVIKYFVALGVLCIALTVTMILSHSVAGADGYTFGETVSFLWNSNARMPAMLVALVVLSLFYPKFGFTTRQVRGTLQGSDKQVAINAFRTAGYELTAEEGDHLTFRAESFLRRLMMLFEDEVTATSEGEWIVIKGNRRGVSRIIYCWDAYAHYAKDEDETTRS